MDSLRGASGDDAHAAESRLLMSAPHIKMRLWTKNDYLCESDRRKPVISTQITNICPFARKSDVIFTQIADFCPCWPSVTVSGMSGAWWRIGKGR